MALNADVSNPGGSVSLAALAGAQPYPVLLPESFGAKGDLKVLSDAAIVTGTNKLSSASKPFKAADVGKYVAVCSAGPVALVEGAEPGATKQWNTLCARIAAFVSSEQVELDTNASHTPAAGALAVYATDDTQAVREAINAAVLKAQETGRGVCAVWFSRMYGIAGQLQTSQEGNAQIPLPLIAATSGGGPAQGQKITLHLWGGPDSTALPLWYQKVPQQSGGGLFSFGPRKAGEAGLVSAVAQPIYNVGIGRPAVIGGPTPEKGFTGLTYSNMELVIEGLTMSGPSNGTLTDLELNGTANLVVKSLGSYRLGIPGLVAGVQGEGPNEFVMPSAGFEGGFEVAKRPACALAEPLVGNNDNTVVYSHSCEGHCSGLEVGEHGTHLSIRTIYCFMGLNPAKSGWIHAAEFKYLSVEACRFGIYTPPNNGAACFINVDSYDYENGVGRWTFVPKGAIWDPEHLMKGEWKVWPGEKAEEELPPKINVASSLRILNMGVTPGKVAAPEYKTEVALTNPFYRDAFVTLTKVTAVEVDGQAQAIATPETASVFVPSGKTIKPTGATGTWKWTLA